MDINDLAEKSEKFRSGVTESNSSLDSKTPYANKTAGEKLTKINAPLKPPVSPTSLLAQNIALLPSGVAKVKQQQPASTPKMNPPNPGSSTGSATGEYLFSEFFFHL